MRAERVQLALFLGWAGMVVIFHAMRHGLVYHWLSGLQISHLALTPTTNWHIYSRVGIQCVVAFFGLKASLL